MEESEKEGKFEYSDIFAYVNDGKYPSEFTKDEKRALRKRAKFFVAKGTSLYYVGGGKQLNFSLLCIDLLRSVYYVSEARLYLWYVNY